VVALLPFFILATRRQRCILPTLLVSPLTQRRARYGSYQSQTQRNIKHRRRKCEDYGERKRNNRCQLRVLHDVRDNKKQQRNRDECQTAIDRIREAKVVPQNEAPGAKQKQQPPECDDNPGSPGDVS